MTTNDVNAAVDWLVATKSGQRIADANNQYAGECLSLVKQYFTRLTGKAAPASGNGKGSGYYSVFPAALRPYFRKEAFVAGKAYPRGSIVVYTKTDHVAVFLSAGRPNCSLFEQNADPDGSPAGTHQRANSRLDGVLVPVVNNPAPAPAPSSSGQHVNLHSNVANWRVYVPNTRTVKATLHPSKFGGLTYEVKGKDSLGRLLIDTQQFGRVGLPVDSDATIY